MAHLHYIEDASGDIVDYMVFCSDFCHCEKVGSQYQGWNGCHELDLTQFCEGIGCSEIVRGLDYSEVNTLKVLELLHQSICKAK